MPPDMPAALAAGSIAVRGPGRASPDRAGAVLRKGRCADPALLEYVLTQPPDRVSYRQLTTYAIKAGILRGEIDLSDLVDRRFIPSVIGRIELR